MQSEVIYHQARVLAECAPRLRAVGSAEALSGEYLASCRELIQKLAVRCEVASGDICWAMKAVPSRHSAPAKITTTSRLVPNDLPEAARETAQIANCVNEVTRLLAQAIGDSEVTGGRKWTAMKSSVAIAGMLSLVLNNRRGIGLATQTGTMLSHAMAWMGTVLGKESLAADIAMVSVLLRMETAIKVHTELREDPLMKALFEAIAEDRMAAAIMRLVKTMKGHGGEDTLAALAPVLPEVLALSALQDENPFNDAGAWELVLGVKPTRDPILGIPLEWISRLDENEGYACTAELKPELAASLASGGLVAWLRTVEEMRSLGQIVVQQIDDEHWLLILPGMAFGAPQLKSPQDLIGAFRNTNAPDSPYTRAVEQAVALAEIPQGARVALVGHSAGGAVAMNLAQNKDFSAKFKVTHVVAVGSPIDFKRPADPETWVASVANQHDIVPTLDGRGAASPYQVPAEWFEVQYVDDSHEFPLCHSAGKYADNLENEIAEQCSSINANLSAYQGAARTTAVYSIYDKRP